MIRDVDRLSSEVFDVVIVGGGIHGACAAMEAAQRGLTVAVIDKGDFGSATSHNSLKIVHGGIRYLQHLDFGRVRQSIKERRFWLSCAPHMVAPLEFWVPLRGWGTRGAAALWSAMRVHETVGFDRNRRVPESRLIPRGRLRSRRDVVQYLGNLWGPNPPSAAVWWDGQMLDADRLILECVLAASRSGAAVANYVEARSLARSQRSKVAGVEVEDKLTGREFLIRARNVVLAAGPWAAPLLDKFGLGKLATGHAGLVRNMNIVVPRKWANRAVGLDSDRPSDAVVGKSKRLYFMTPWRDCSIIGTTHEPYIGDPDNFQVRPEEVSSFVAELNQSCPALALDSDDVRYVYAGLTPSGGDDGSSARSRSSEVRDHGRTNGLDGVYSIFGVKYTTARALAERAINLLARRTSKVRRSATARTPLPGAVGMGSAEHLLDEIQRAGSIDPEDALDLAIAYGNRYREVLDLADSSLDRQSILDARVKFAARKELACTLSDILFRRLDWLPRSGIDSSKVGKIADTLALELDWDDNERRVQCAEFEQKLDQPVRACR